MKCDKRKGAYEDWLRLPQELERGLSCVIPEVTYFKKNPRHRDLE